MGFLASLAAIFPLDNLGHYIHWHWFLVSVSNAVVILLMIIVFWLAVSLPFPGRRSRKEGQ